MRSLVSICSLHPFAELEAELAEFFLLLLKSRRHSRCTQRYTGQTLVLGVQGHMSGCM